MAFIRGLLTEDEMDKLKESGILPDSDTPVVRDEDGVWAEFYVDCNVYELLTHPLGSESCFHDGEGNRI